MRPSAAARSGHTSPSTAPPPNIGTGSGQSSDANADSKVSTPRSRSMVRARRPPGAIEPVTLLQSDAVPSRPRVCPRLFVGPLVWLGALGAIGLGGAACDGATSVTITSAAAGHLWEGLGCGTRGCEGTCTVDGCPGGRRAPLVLVATDAPLVSASATIPGTDIDVHVDVLAQAAGRAALAVRIPVTTALGAGEHDLELEVVATDGSAATTRLSAQTFDELVLANERDVPPPGPYSTIVVPTAIVAHLTGPAAARLVAIGDIDLAGILSVDATATGPGPGGCAGAASASAPAGCPPGGGRSSLTDDGGGGGFGGAGGGPLGGAVTGDDSLVPLGPGAGPIGDDNRGHGGGAHADDAGGHGGGGLALIGHGRIVVGQYARITARGGAPALATGRTGGGGSGGALVIGAHAGFEISAAAALPFEATGGGAGAVRGGDGRLRLDSPDDSGDLVGAAPRPWLGPAWTGLPLVVGADAEVALRIDPRATAPITITRTDSAEVATCVPNAGGCRARLALPVGVTGLCAHVRADVALDLAENASCVMVVRIE